MRAPDIRPLSLDVLYVYPTALKAGTALREHARRGGCLLGHRVTTFPELTDALARDLRVAPRVLEPEMAAVVLAGATLAPGMPAAFRAARRGLLHELLRVIAEFRAAYLGPDEACEIARKLTNGAAATRLMDLAQVYASYESSLGSIGAVDRHGRDWRVCEGLAAAEAGGDRPAILAGVSRIVFAEIYDYSVLQFLIATSLIRLVGDAELIAFASGENVDATRFLDRTWNRFVGDPAIADQVLPSFVARRGRQGSLAAALRGVFAQERPPRVPPDGSIRIVVAPNRYREVEAAVRAVRREIAGGASPERFALVARDLSLYGDLIEDVCRRYRVPVYFRKGRPLLANPLVKACVNLLRCVVEGYPRGRLEAVLESDYFGATPARSVRVLRQVGYGSEAARPLADCIAHRRAMLAADAASAATPAERRASALRQAEVLAGAGDALADLRATLGQLDRRRTIAGHVAVLRRTLRRLRLRPVLASDDAAVAARRDGRAWERLEETLAALGGLARELRFESISLAEFLRFVLAALEPQEIEDRAERAGSVRALGILDARGLDFEVVYLLGLDDGTFPAPRAESPLWPDAMRREVNPLAASVLRRKLGARAEGLPLGGLFRTAREGSLEDPFLFFLALSMAERELVLSYPTTNERGNPTIPSPFLDEVRACHEGPLPEVVLAPRALVPVAAECCEVAELVGRAAEARWTRQATAEPDRLTAALAAASPDLASRSAAIDTRAQIEERRARYFLSPHGTPRKDTRADAYVGRLAGDTRLLRDRLAAMRWSPTRLETLGTCGFKFYAQYLLGLGEEDEPPTEVGQAERGTLAHATLEALFRAHPRLPGDAATVRALAREFAARERDAAARRILAKDPMLLAVTWRQVTAAIEEVLAAARDEQAELAGEGIAVDYLLETPLELTLPDPAGGPSVVLTGTPDRVEVRRRGAAAVGLRVLDYKMSKNAKRYGPLLNPQRQPGRTGFQIPVYLLAALARFPEVPAEATLEGAYSLLLADQKTIRKAFSRDLLDQVATGILALVEGARQGRFDVDPEPCDPYCRHRAVCRYQRPPLEDEATP